MSLLFFLIFVGWFLFSRRPLWASELDDDIHKKFKTLPEHEFVSYFNSLNHSWTITEYGDDIHMHFRAKREANHGLPTMTHDDMDLPLNFDAREKWPQCETIRQINKQGLCHSCYLFGAIDSASDRTCIHTDVHVHLSAQEGDCIRPSDACEGGFLTEGLKYWTTHGLVSADCKPYDVRTINGGCKEKCANSSIEYIKDKHFGGKVYQIESDIDAIRAEIVKNGPVVTGFKVFEDFRKYHKGVYHHKFGNEIGLHAVRLIGFGTDEQGVDYWLLANSWGPYWGEEGFFRIQRGQSLLELEDNVFAGLPRK